MLAWIPIQAMNKSFVKQKVAAEGEIEPSTPVGVDTTPPCFALCLRAQRASYARISAFRQGSRLLCSSKARRSSNQSESQSESRGTAVIYAGMSHQRAVCKFGKFREYMKHVPHPSSQSLGRQKRCSRNESGFLTHKRDSANKGVRFETYSNERLPTAVHSSILPAVGIVALSPIQPDRGRVANASSFTAMLVGQSNGLNPL